MEPNNAENDAVIAEVAKFFEETIEKRGEGYYIPRIRRITQPYHPTGLSQETLTCSVGYASENSSSVQDYDQKLRAHHE